MTAAAGGAGRQPTAAESPFSRSEALLGADAMRRLAAARVIVFGVGGVGGWCAEALARSGVGAIAVVDGDVVEPSNINRQAVATSATIGRPKVDVIAGRLVEINPGIRVEPHRMRFCADTEEFFSDAISRCDCVVDAIDSLEDKRRLARLCESLGAYMVSSMGAALRTDPTLVRAAPFSKVAGDPLARALRRLFREDGGGALPDFQCAYTEERAAKRGALGSMMPVTATFGMVLASLAISWLTHRDANGNVVS